MKEHTRRTFLTATASASVGLAVGTAQAASTIKTIGNVIDKIIQEMVGEKLGQTVDTLKSGNPNDAVSGITSTMFATMQVIEKSIELGNNFIITHEPTFYNHLDETDWLKNNPVYQKKIQLLNDHRIAVWRCHDYIHRMQPDGIVSGMVEALDWQKFRTSNSPCFRVPGKSVKTLANELKRKLNIDRVRVVGDVDMTVETAGLLVGAPGGQRQILFAEKHKPDVLICGEINEWETSEYIRDANLQGQKCALIILGHIASEQQGMHYFSLWLKKIMPNIKVNYISIDDPFTFI